MEPEKRFVAYPRSWPSVVSSRRTMLYTALMDRGSLFGIFMAAASLMICSMVHLHWLSIPILAIGLILSSFGLRSEDRVMAVVALVFCTISVALEATLIMPGIWTSILFLLSRHGGSAAG